MKNTFTMGGCVLPAGDGPYVVAEIGVNFNGELALAKKMIAAAAAAGADAVKFQSFRAEEFMADRSGEYAYESAGQTVRESMYAMFKRLELPAAWHGELQAQARAHGVEFLSSAADPASADLLAGLQVPALKIASEDLVNLPLLEHVGRLRIPIILSTGMADEAEIEQAVQTLRRHGTPDLLLLHCVSLYPTPDEGVNLLRMTRLAERFGTLAGFSDHSKGTTAAVAAAALGAVLIEKHFTLDKSLPGPDHAFSADPGELAELVRAVQCAARQRGRADLQPSPAELAARRQFRRSVVAAVDVPAGTVLTREMLCLKRPGTGLAPRHMDELIGRRARQTFRVDEQIRWDQME